MQKKIYLAGPITGKSWGESENWRDRFKQALKDTAPHIHGYSPLREKSEILKKEAFINDSYENTLFSSQRAIMSRDFFDVQTSDAVVANLRDATTVSIGTVMEMAWAYQRRIPLIVITEFENGRIKNLHDHAMLREAANWWVETEEEALEVVRALFTP